MLLLKLFKELGPKWTPMSDHFPGRNGIGCRNRFRKFRTGGRLSNLAKKGQGEELMERDTVWSCNSYNIPRPGYASNSGPILFSCQSRL